MRVICGRYLWERSVSITWRSITHGSTDRKKVLQTAAIPVVRSMRSVLRWTLRQEIILRTALPIC
jgi:tagatose-1,6-bisphosphate aldolase